MLDRSFRHFNANYIQLFDLKIFDRLLGVKKYLFLDYKYRTSDNKSLALSRLDFRKIKYKLISSTRINNRPHYIFHCVEVNKKYADEFELCMKDLVYYMYYDDNYDYFLIANKYNVRLWIDGLLKYEPRCSTNLKRINESLKYSKIADRDDVLQYSYKNRSSYD